MNAPLRRAGVVVFVLFAMLFINLNWIQVYKSTEYTNSQYNGRLDATEYERPRGKIINAQGVAIADNSVTNDTLKYLRVYPFNEQYAHVIGYKPVDLTSTGVERLENSFLNGKTDAQAASRLNALFNNQKAIGGNVLLTLSKAAQESAYKELKANKNGVPKGAVVAIRPDTGAVLASVSLPSYDPKLLTTHDTDIALKNYKRLTADPNKPLLNRATGENFPPGSTMKVITSAALMKELGYTPDTQLVGGDFYTPPQTNNAMKNATGVVCPEQITLKQALTVSCNTAFARAGVEHLGNQKLISMAEAFGFGPTVTFGEDTNNVYGVAQSLTGTMTAPDGRVDAPALAQSCIGQNNVRMTPLEGAMVAATVANNGSRMRPYVINQLQTSDLTKVSTTEPSEINKPVSPEIAAGLQTMMESVVQNGTAKRAQVNMPGVVVGGKTGTAENAEDAQDHGWFIGFAMKDGKPLIAVSVFLENAGKGGSAEASRIGGLVMSAYINEAGGK